MSISPSVTLTIETTISLEQRLELKAIINQLLLDLQERFFIPILAVTPIFRQGAPACPCCGWKMRMQCTDMSATCLSCDYFFPATIFGDSRFSVRACAARKRSGLFPALQRRN